MSCPSCGAKLEVSNQRFCQDCGAKLPQFSKASKISQYSSYSAENRSSPQIQQKPTSKYEPRPLSKRSLALGIVSLVIAITSFNFGSSLIMEPIILSFFSSRNIFLIFGAVNSVGIVFGSFSIFFNRNAQNSEMKNKAMKAGRTIGPLGLIFNIILAFIAFSYAIFGV
jgi:hypothetical protein